MSLFKGNWDLPNSGEKILPDEEDAVIDKLAKKVVDRGMAVPAIMFLESVKPLNFIGAQTMIFFEPIVQAVFNFKDYDVLRTALEKRETIEIMLLRIEKFDAVSHAREKRIKKYLKVQKKTWKWYQRYLGLFTPKVEYPDEVLNGPQAQAQKKDEA